VAELVLELPYRYADALGASYRVRVLGEPRPDGFWDGWLAFVGEEGITRRTDHDTLQASRDDLVVWATGLEPTYVEGAFARASPAAHRR
jgi:hypothetical protein